MIFFLETALRGVLSNGAETREGAAAPWLRGRTYAISFDRVWQASLALAQGGLPRWSILDADDYEGVINVEIKVARLRPAARVTIRIGLTADAQTRVDARAHAPDRRGDLGVCTRALARFFTELDRSLSEEADHPAMTG
jgi:hypothetical protein